jgi:LPXTG-motif cell wall-anchored protein
VLLALLLALTIAPRALAAGPTVAAVQDPTLGLILVDADGHTLYRFTRDTTNTSSACYGNCAVRWPPLLVEDGVPVAGEGVNGELLGILTRTDGTRQVMYNGMPLYYYANDTQAGQTSGQGVGSVWYIVKPNTTTAGGQGVTLRSRKDAALGDILTDGNGWTMYLYTRDTQNTTVCYDRCATAWPPLLAGTGVEPQLDGIGGTLGTIVRNDGNRQVTYNGIPLYYFVNDKQAGETKGQGVGNVWYIITPTAAASQAPAAPASAAPAPVPAALPRTGEGDSAPFAALGLLALMLAVAGAAIRLRKA